MSMIIETDFKEILNKLDANFAQLETKIDNGFQAVNDRLIKLEITVIAIVDGFAKLFGIIPN